MNALEYVTRKQLGGVYNVAGGGQLPWSEVATICGTRPFPLPPWRSRFGIAALVRAGYFHFPPELEALLRYGRGIDTRRLVDTGFRYRYTSAGAVKSFADGLRLRRWAGRDRAQYRYEHDVEQFFRHSPAVVSSRDS